MNYRVVKEVDDIDDLPRMVEFLRDTLGKEFTYGEYNRSLSRSLNKDMNPDLRKAYDHIRGNVITNFLTVESLLTVHRAKNWWAGRLMYTDLTSRKVHNEFAFLVHDEFIALQLKLMIE
jgi:hypothetical protein